jgi:hypothetical protein
MPRSPTSKPKSLPLKNLLDNYTTSHPLRSPSPLPPSSRVDPSLTQRLPPQASNPLFWTIPTWFAFLQFLLAKGWHIIWSLISHFIWGPARKSWGYRMTFVSLMYTSMRGKLSEGVDHLVDEECSGTFVVGGYRPD